MESFPHENKKFIEKSPSREDLPLIFERLEKKIEILFFKLKASAKFQEMILLKNIQRF